MNIAIHRMIRTTLITPFCLLASAFAADPAPATPRPSALTATASGLHRVAIKARIDAYLQIVFQDGRMFLNGKGSPAESLVVNNRKWKPTYTQGVSEDFKFSQPLMPFNGKTIASKLNKEARVSVNITEQPTDQNGQKLVLEVKDSAAGASEFELVITW